MTRYPTNRERLMDATGDLLYQEGLHAVTVDRLAGEAGLTKPTIYNLFGSKEGLLAETLERRAEQIRRHIEERIAAHDDPRRKLMELLQVHAEMLTSEGFHGCPLATAATQAPGSGVARDLADRHKAWLLGQMSQLAKRAGLRAPDALAWTLLLLLEGAAALSAVQQADVVVKHARAAVRAILASHT